ncbi:MAG TPA: YoaK family protein [Rhizomicrobium sp.]|jgi:uncharacterized membrane protein YoaK (UPF0700 family)
MADKPRALASPDFALAVALAALAGWVDATAYVRLSRIFVSFMSGNSTRLAASLSAAASPKAALTLAVLAAFVGGVILGETIAIVAGKRGHAAALLLESVVLFAAMGAAWPAGSLFLPAVLLAIALGVQNASVHQAGGMRVALTYVTGTLVRLGRRIAAALAGRGPWRDALPYLFLWLGMMAGAAGGAALARTSAVLAIALAGTAAFVFAGVALLRRPT